MKRQIKAGSTSVTLIIFIQDSSSATGAGLPNLVFNSSGLTCYYARPGVAAAQLTLVTQTVTGAFSSGGFVAIDNTNMPGWYRLDIADAMVASGKESVAAVLRGATNMAPLAFEIELVQYDPQNGVRLGLTALPNAAATAAGGLPVSTAGSLNLDAIKTKTDSLTFTVGGRVDANVLNFGGTAVTARDIGASVLLSSGSGTGQINLTSGNVTLAGVVHGGDFSSVTGITLGNTSHGGTGAILTLSSASIGSSTSGVPGVTVSGGNATLGALDLVSFTGAPLSMRSGSGNVTVNASGNLAISGQLSSGTNALPWNGNWDAEIESEVADGLGVFWTSPANLVDLVWDEPTSGHTTAGSTGKAIADGTAASVLASGDVDGYSLEETLKLCLSALVGKLSGAATTTVTIRASDDSKDRITATVDVDGNRSAVTLDGAG